MRFPEVEIRSGDSIQEADARVELAFRRVGLGIQSFDPLNAYLSSSSFCHFFRSRLDGRECVLCVTVGLWDDATVLSILNLLLNIRMDPDPPGSPPAFGFYSAHPAPPVLLGLFGDSPASEFECRAALVAQFGNGVGPGMSLQLAAVGIHLLRECFGVRTDLFHPEGELQIGDALVKGFAAEAFPSEASPINSLVALGFLFGEQVRARLRCPSRWTFVKDYAPWPALVLGEIPEAKDVPVPQVVFSPIAWVMKCYEEGEPGLLREVALSLAGKCRETLGQG
ncbi:MAG: hypothetical protein HY721_30665 [Planctomycetes bacterium]|nr:hypothetical protein [Planctomycetota bacterium]